MSGQRSPLLEQHDLPLPDCARHVWEWFWELNKKRTFGFSSMNPLAWVEIASWSQLTGNRPLPWELDALNGIDGAFMAANAPDPPKKTPPKK